MGEEKETGRGRDAVVQVRRYISQIVQSELPRCAQLTVSVGTDLLDPGARKEAASCIPSFFFLPPSLGGGIRKQPCIYVSSVFFHSFFPLLSVTAIMLRPLKVEKGKGACSTIETTFVWPLSSIIATHPRIEPELARRGQGIPRGSRNRPTGLPNNSFCAPH